MGILQGRDLVIANLVGSHCIDRNAIDGRAVTGTIDQWVVCSTALSLEFNEYTLPVFSRPSRAPTEAEVLKLPAKSANHAKQAKYANDRQMHLPHFTGQLIPSLKCCRFKVSGIGRVRSMTSGSQSGSDRLT